MESTYSIRKDGKTLAQSPLPNLGYDARTLAGMARAGYTLWKDGIRARRKALRMSQAELAHRVGVSQSLICMIEKGRCGVAPQTMRMIEEALEEMEGAMT